MRENSGSAPALPGRAQRLIPLFLRPRAILDFLRDRRASRSSKIVFILALVYTLLPTDFIPDILPVVGWLDDAGFLAVAVTWGLNRVAAHARAFPETAAVPEASD